MKITLYDQRKTKTITDHCHSRNIRLSENIRVNKGPQSEEEGRHQKLSELVDVMLKKRKGTKEKRFESGFKLGELKYYLQHDKRASKKLYTDLRKANMLLPVKNYGDFKLTMMPDRPVEEYRVYIHGLMTQDPYHLTNNGNGNNIYLFAVNPDGAVRKAGESFGAKIDNGKLAGSASGAGGNTGSSPEVASVGSESSSLGKKKGSKEKQESYNSGNTLVLNDQAEWVVQKTTTKPKTTRVATNEKKLGPVIRGSDLPKKPSRNISSTNQQFEVQESVSKEQEEKKNFKLKSIFTEEDRKLFNGIEVESESTEESVSPQVNRPTTRRRRSISSPTGSQSPAPNRNREVTSSLEVPDFKGVEVEVRGPIVGSQNLNITHVVPTRKEESYNTNVFNSRGSGRLSCSKIREYILENYRNRQICGLTLENYSRCESDFRSKILAKCEQLFHGKYSVEEDQYWVDNGKGTLTSIQRCSQMLEQMTEMYMPMLEEGEVKTNLVSSFYEIEAAEKINLENWLKVKKLVQRKKGIRYSDIYCSEKVKYKKRFGRDLEGIEQLIEIKTGKSLSFNASNCKKYVDQNLPQLLVKYEKNSPKDLKTKISDNVLYYGGLNYIILEGKKVHPSTLVGAKREEVARDTYSKAKDIYDDLKMFMDRYEVKNFINPRFDEEIGVVNIIEDKIEMGVGKRCKVEKPIEAKIKAN